MAKSDTQNPICQACRHFRHCKNPCVTGISEAGSPKKVLVLPFPEAADDAGRPFQGEHALAIFGLLADRLDEVYITYLVKCPTWQNELSPERGFKEPPKEAVQHCLKHLQAELDALGDDVELMPFGAFATRTLAGEDFKFMAKVGSWCEMKLGERTYKFMPNLDPRQATKHPALKAQWERTTKRFFESDSDQIASLAETRSRYEILSPNKALKYMDEMITRYKDRAIEYTLFDFETSVDVRPFKGGDIIMSSLMAPGDKKAVSIPFSVQPQCHWEEFKSRIDPINYRVSEHEKRKLIEKSLELLYTIPIGGHNLKYDLRWGHWCWRLDPRKVRIFMDTYNVAVQVNSMGGGIDNSLKGLARSLFNVTDDWDEEIWSYLGKFKLTKDRHFGMLPTGILGRYAALDSYYNVPLIEYYRKNASPEAKRVAELVTRTSAPYAIAENTGMMVDQPTYAFLMNSYDDYISAKYLEIIDLPQVRKMFDGFMGKLVAENDKRKEPKPIEDLYPKALNLKYAPKVGALYYDPAYYALPTFRGKKFRTKTGAPGTGKDIRAFFLKEFLTDERIEKESKKNKHVARRWSEARVFLKHLDLYKRFCKLRDEYLATMRDDMDGWLLRTSFNPNGTITGRASSPFHSMPNRCDIKRIVCSRWKGKGGFIVAPDQSQLELRVAAALSKEQNLIDAFVRGEDPHSATGALLFNVPVDEVTSQQRQFGKTYNFAMLFGKTEENLANDLRIPVVEAQRLLRMFYARLGTLSKWKDERYKIAKETGYAPTVWGRRIPIPSWESNTEYDNAETERLAVNYPVQSTATDTVTDWWTTVEEQRFKKKMQSIFLACVHDSVEYDAYPGELFSMVRLLKHYGQDIMQDKHEWLICPLELSFEIGTSWGGALECKIKEVSDDHIVMHAEGLRRDFKSFVREAENAYKIEVSNLEYEPVDAEKRFGEDILYKDRQVWTGDIYMERA